MERILTPEQTQQLAALNEMAKFNNSITTGVFRYTNAADTIPQVSFSYDINPEVPYVIELSDGPGKSLLGAIKIHPDAFESHLKSVMANPDWISTKIRLLSLQSRLLGDKTIWERIALFELSVPPIISLLRPGAEAHIRQIKEKQIFAGIFGLGLPAESITWNYL